MNKDIAIKVENLSKVYKLYNAPIDRMKEALHPFKKSYHKEFYALNDVSFEIKKGETVGIIGKNGSGKSTLLKIVTGVLTPTTGKVTVNGRISALLELGAGFNPEYTGMENIYFQGNLMGFEREEMEAKVQEILDFADIGDFIHQPVKNYSSGMFARLAFAVAINVEPEILIVDEALSVGDMAFQNKCMNKMKQLMEKDGCTVVFVSHSLAAVRLVCEKAIWINSGVLEKDGDVDLVTDLYETSMFKRYNENAKNVESDSVTSQVINGEFNQISLIDRGEKDENDTSCVLVGCSILDEESNFITEASTFQNISLRIHVRSNFAFSVSVGIAFIDKNSLLTISRINNLRDDIDIRLSHGENYITAKFPKLSLLTGEYYISIFLAHDDLLRTIHKVENAFTLSLRTPLSSSGWRRYEGVTSIEHKWSIS